MLHAKFYNGADILIASKWQTLHIYSFQPEMRLGRNCITFQNFLILPSRLQVESGNQTTHQKDFFLNVQPCTILDLFPFLL